jgi:phosphatidylserine/phosphatidylglycerophosphate/cardiolipin synthase-like enzyme
MYSKKRYDALGKRAEQFVARVLIDVFGKDAVSYTGADNYYYDFLVQDKGAVKTFEVKAQHGEGRTGCISLMWEHPSRITMARNKADYYMLVTAHGLFCADAAALKDALANYLDAAVEDKHKAVWLRESLDGGTLVEFTLEWLRKHSFVKAITTSHTNPLSPESKKHLRPVN